jgi:S-adenosylmethionine uptake transporter
MINKNLQAILWLLASFVISNLNDVLTKYLGNDLHYNQVIFFRFLFSFLTLLPFIALNGINQLKTKRINLHVIRGAVLFIAIWLWSAGIGNVHISVATTLSCTIPIFVLIMSFIFLKEHITWQKITATLIGFAGIVVVSQPYINHLSSVVFLLILSVILFASLDIINKKYVIAENNICMLFYSALITTIISIPFLWNIWKTPSFKELILLLSLGAGANLVLFFLLQAFAKTDISNLAPLRYFELVVSVIMGYIIFNEIPSHYTIISIIIIIPSSLWIVRNVTESPKQKIT